MEKYVVKPLSSKRETIILLIIFVIIFFIYIVSIKIIIRKPHSIVVNKNEISSYEHFNSNELNYYGQIANSLIEIEFLYEEYHALPTVNELKANMISPFDKHETSMYNVAYDWKLIEKNNNYYYLAISSEHEQMGNFLIKVNIKKITDSEILYSKEEIKMDDIRSFKKIIPYTGKNERDNY